MKAPPFEYHRADSLDEALSHLSTHENAKILAGGQSLVAMLNLRYVFPDHLVDINPIAELAGIEIRDERVRVGAMTRQRAMEVSPELRQAAPIFKEALALVGHRQTRNRGTFGGSLCHLDPSAELPTLALLYDASVHVASTRGRRTVAMSDFILGYMTPAIEIDELVAAIEIDAWPRASGWAFLEHARRHGDFAIASVACLIEADDARTRVRRVALAIGGLVDRPIRLVEGESRLTGAVADAETFRAAALACEDFEPLPDLHASSAYRQSVATTLVQRALTRAWARAIAPETSAS